MFYQLSFDMERIDAAIQQGCNTIYAQTSNLKEIEYEGYKKGFFRNAIFSSKPIEKWPEIIFYYSSLASNIESEYLLNIVQWPIIHIKVKEQFVKSGIKGIKYIPIKLVDVVTNNINENYVAMYITNFIDAYDMSKTSFRYNEKYNSYSFTPNKIFLNVDICQNHDIFRCEKHPAIIYVSQRMKDIVDEKNWIGFAFHQQP